GNKPYQFYQKTRDGKQILRDAMKRHIPEVVTRAQKQGFSAPDASWFKGDSIEFVKRTLLGSDSEIYSFLDKPTVEKLVKEHLNGTENRRLLIWSLLNVEQWLKEKNQ
ncbi:MAG: asparagine synthetase B, partial [Flavobacteriaceae bacterium]|nr:asparagine synthetase B [Flavobacteriaceae bacterium]